ncbi:exo-beta-1,3-glucanase [Mycena metata]|uniref:Exo-beta-1,3-glucanase n=1 Tax=Mycena metata TaxID=1033252 RepID=A0AAD7HET1_9AGAR|nr:exo-beta-1,3-glucanase [Mycena metata]
MLSSLFVTVMGLALASVPSVSSLGTTCSAPLGGGTRAATDPFWMQSIKHQGIAAFNANPSSYQVFRNVKDFGAKGDGVTDDAAAINLAISSGSRCGGTPVCKSSSTTPAVIFFPKGTYLVKSSILPYYYTQLIGDATSPPTLLADASFTSTAVIDADPSLPGGGEYYTNQNNFFRSVRNFVIDVTRVPPQLSQGTGIHWQVSQATSLINIVSAHQGIYMENGSGGFMGDLIFNGGKFGMWVGNQQFTVRNITVNNAQTAVFGIWNWGWTFQNVNINNCGVGFDLSSGSTSTSQKVGAEAIIDATATNTPIFLRTSSSSNGQLIGAGSLVLNNIKLNNVPSAVVSSSGTVLAGGTTTIASWAQGNLWTGSNTAGKFTQGNIAAPPKPAVLLDSSGKIFGRAHPQYEGYAVSQFVSVRDQGAKGDGSTDDTAALKAIFAAYAGCKIIFFDAGTYVVTSTLTIPAGTQVVGEGYGTVIAGRGSAFQNINSPQVVVQAGAPGSSGTLEITDIQFATIGPTPGAIVLEWNVKQTTQGGAGMWDSYIRLGGATGTNLQTNCPSSGSGGTTNCFAAFLGLHLTSGSSAYLEGTWVWAADHNLDGDGVAQISIYSGRGILSQSAGPVWMIGTASEHHVLYQYSLVGASNHYMGLIQTETPYYQPSPAPPAPFTINSAFSDPASGSGLTSAWGLVVSSSTNILVFGAGLYSWFTNYNQDCLTPQNCQSQILNIDSTSSVSIYSLQTVGVTYSLSINGAGVVNQNANPNGFAATLTAWTRS